MEMTTPPPDDDSGVVCEICHKKVFEHSFEEQYLFSMYQNQK